MKKPKRLHELSEEERIKHSDDYVVQEAERQRLEKPIEKKTKAMNECVQCGEKFVPIGAWWERSGCCGPVCWSIIRGLS